MRFARFAPLLAALAPFAACSKSSAPPAAAPLDAGACTSPPFAGSPLGVRCNALVDAEGRTVLLHGVNARVPGVFDVTFDDGRQPVETLPPFDAPDAARIRALGFNALRLPIDWSAIEPTESGGFNDSYLGDVATVVALCKDAGLYVLLDFHQDAYSKEIGEDGAPLWAIVPPPTQLLGGPLGGDLGHRRDSKQVSDAFATFFGSSADGQRLRARFTQMLAHVAGRFANDPAVIGFEIYNEPLTSDDALQSLYPQAIAAIRAAAPAKLVFFEPSVLRNELDQAPLGAGNLAPGTVYAPHVYTLAFTDPNADFRKDMLTPSNQSARDEADSWGAPLAITEYGFDPSNKSFASYVRWEQEAQDEARASAFFWLWKEESQGSWGFYDFDANGNATERVAVVSAMTRARLEAVAGALASVAYDADAKRLEVRFLGDASVPATNTVSLGAAIDPPASAWKATCDGASVPTGGADPLQIACGGAGEHVIVVSGGQ